MNDKLKSRFEQILQENDNSIMWSHSAKELIFKNMQSVYDLCKEETATEMRILKNALLEIMDATGDGGACNQKWIFDKANEAMHEPIQPPNQL